MVVMRTINDDNNDNDNYNNERDKWIAKKYNKNQTIIFSIKYDARWKMRTILNFIGWLYVKE